MCIIYSRQNVHYIHLHLYNDNDITLKIEP